MSKNMKSSRITLEAYQAATARIASGVSRLGDKAICDKYVLQVSVQMVNAAFEGV